jgi:hypothetical protein
MDTDEGNLSDASTIDADEVGTITARSDYVESLLVVVQPSKFAKPKFYFNVISVFIVALSAFLRSLFQFKNETTLPLYWTSTSIDPKLQLKIPVRGSGLSKPQLSRHAAMMVYGDKASSPSPRYDFVMDSGATEHMVGTGVLLCDTTSYRTPVKLGNKQTLMTSEKGTLKFGNFNLTGVLKIEGLSRNLISEGQLDSKGCKIEHGRKTIYGPDGKVCFVATLRNGLYVFEPDGIESFLAGSKPTSSLELWHMRMGHLNIKDLKELSKLSTGMEITSRVPMDLCTACVKAKMHETKYDNQGLKASRMFEILYCDVVVQFPVPTPEGHVNSVTLIDKFSNYSWVENFRAKSDIAPWLIRFFEQAKRESSPVDQIQFFSTDKGGEFFNKVLKT